jgi:hypothetical protein
LGIGYKKKKKSYLGVQSDTTPDTIVDKFAGYLQRTENIVDFDVMFEVSHRSKWGRWSNKLQRKVY